MTPANRDLYLLLITAALLGAILAIVLEHVGFAVAEIFAHEPPVAAMAFHQPHEGCVELWR